MHRVEPRPLLELRIKRLMHGLTSREIRIWPRAGFAVYSAASLQGRITYATSPISFSFVLLADLRCLTAAFWIWICWQSCRQRHGAFFWVCWQCGSRHGVCGVQTEGFCAPPPERSIWSHVPPLFVPSFWCHRALRSHPTLTMSKTVPCAGSFGVPLAAELPNLQFAVNRAGSLPRTVCEHPVGLERHAYSGAVWLSYSA